MRIQPRLLTADPQGNIKEHPRLLMLQNSAGNWSLPDESSLVPLPAESELFLLPGRKAAGFDPASGEIKVLESLAVSAFAAPGYTLSGHPAFEKIPDAPVLPLFAYGAVGYYRNRFWICATKVDEDRRQCFKNIKPGRIIRESERLLKNYPHNRLVSHIINNCVRRYDCPAARNFALGRYEAPLPTSQSCNARCIGCISQQGEDSAIKVTPQCRLAFTPTPREIVEVMQIHGQREKNVPVYSFGQGCEGDPILNSELLCESIRLFRKKGGTGTVNCNTNASLPGAVAKLAAAGLTSIRVSLNSAVPELYTAYYRPQNYEIGDVLESMRIARRLGVHVSLNLLYFPGITDTPAELASLSRLCSACGVSFIQMRNLNIDPDLYIEQLAMRTNEPGMGLRRFMTELQTLCPWLKFGYFNPFLGTKAVIEAPMPA